MGANSTYLHTVHVFDDHVHRHVLTRNITVLYIVCMRQTKRLARTLNDLFSKAFVVAPTLFY